MRELPGRIRAALPAELGLSSRQDVLGNSDAISSSLTKAVEEFDAALGDAVKALCPDPTTLTEEQAKAIAAEHRDIIQRAQHGTTVAIALVIPSFQLVWSVGLGDSTVREYWLSLQRL